MKQWVFVGSGWAFILCAVVAGLFFFTDTFHTNPIPENIRNQADFTTSYPADLPEGYSIQKNSYEFTRGVVSYKITGPSPKVILVTQQKAPSEFNFTEFQTKYLKQSRSVTTKTPNAAYVGTLEGNTVASLRNGASWVLLSANSKTTSVAELEKIVSSFTE